MTDNLSVPTFLAAANLALREGIYRGEIFTLPATQASRQLVQAVRELLAGRLEHLCSDPRQAQFQTTNDDFFSVVTGIRQEIAEAESYRQKQEDLLAELGFEIPGIAYDVLRLRAVQHAGHQNPRAAAAYFAHRDTWYSNPLAQINFWLPLYDVSADQGFSIYPDYFLRPVKNSSAQFDYAEFKKYVGWQNHRTAAAPTFQAVYPTATEPFDPSQARRFALRAGEILIFSAAHLHQTYANLSGQTRFSIDFRVVHLADQQAGQGAVNVDTCAVGSTLADYRTVTPITQDRRDCEPMV